ncbi:MAG: K(+)-transporting ATPase subunit F [Phycicoccus sp.]
MIAPGAARRAPGAALGAEPGHERHPFEELAPADLEDRVKTTSRHVNQPSYPPWSAAGGGALDGMWEDLVGGGLAVLLLAYLLYALVRPERF